MRKTAFAVLAALLLANGCTSKYGSQITDVNHYPNCYAPIAELRTDENNVQTGTGAGAAIGAFMGALVGYAATGKASGAVAGAATGAVVGGLAGYGIAKHKTESDAKVRLANYAEAVGQDVNQMDVATASASKARQCYEAAFDTARADFKNNRISAAEFEARYKEIRSGLLETANILDNISINMTEKDKEYREALAWEAQQREMPVPDPAVYTVGSSASKGKSKTKQPVKASSDPELDAMARQNASFINSQSSLDKEKEATQAAIDVFDQNAHDLMGIGA